MRIKINIQRYTVSDLWALKGPIANTVLRPRKISNLLKAKTSQALRLKKARGFPHTLLIEPSTRCNLKCPMCPRSYMAVPLESGNMSLESYSCLIDEIGDSLMFLLIFGNGEPLLNPHILEMVSLAKEKDIFVVLSTNGLLLDKEKADKMLASPPDLLVVSLDAATAETYEKYRVGGDFNKVLTNTKYLSERKRLLGKKTPLIDIQFLAMKENERELMLADQLLERTGADRYSIKKVSSYYTDPKKERIREFLPAGNPELVFSVYVNSSAPPTAFCSFPWRQTAVNWDGNVIPCCKDIDNHHILGNVFDGATFAEVWNNDLYMAFRGQVKEDIENIDICRGCNRRAEGEIFFK